MRKELGLECYVLDRVPPQMGKSPKSSWDLIASNKSTLVMCNWCPGPESNRHGVTTEGF